MTMNIWQVSAADGERDCSEVFLKYGVMLIGPGGEFGDYRKNEDAYNKNSKMTAQRRRTLRQFKKEADENDLVVLKHAYGRKWGALAVGKIKSEYSFEAVFGDVEGFQLQHCRHVDWRQTSQTAIPGLGRGGGSFSRVNDEQARETVERLWEKGKRKKSDQIPPEPEEVSREALIDSLLAEGLTRQRAERIADEILRLRELAKWYESNDDNYDVREHETRTFLIVPLIMSLGWIEQNVKIELDRMDVVLFDGPYSKQNKPVVIIESKRLWHGLGGASDQAKEYAKKHPTCYRLIVTDGIRYKLFTKRGGEWHFSDYMNLLAPKRVHPYKPDVAGAVSFLSKMIPKEAI
jgi:hypothetical protein